MGLIAVLRGFVVPGTYAVLLDEPGAAAILGGDPADRPRAGETVIVVTSMASAIAAADATLGEAVTLPPPIVLVGGVARLSLAHRVRLTVSADPSAVRGPFRAERIGEYPNFVPAADASRSAVGFAVWRAGPLGAD